MGGTGSIVISPASAAGHGSSTYWWQDEAPAQSQDIYLCVVTGQADGLEDVTLPMSSFQYRLYADGRSYLSVVVPNAVLHAPMVAARLAGTLVIEKGIRLSETGQTQTSEMARAPLAPMRTDTGPRSSSLTITAQGQVQFTFDPAVDKKVEAIITHSLQNDGRTRLRCAPVWGLFPGDVVLVEGGYYLVDYISVAVGAHLNQMEITYSAGAVGTLYALGLNTNQDITGF